MILIKILFFYLLFLNNFSFSEIVHLKGQIKCLENNLANITIKLYEEDLFDPDDLLATTITDSEGFYEIKGEQNEWFGRIEPYLNIKHNCQFNNKNKKCEYIHNLPILLEEKDDLIESEEYNINFGKLDVNPSSEECLEINEDKDENISLSRKERTDDESEEKINNNNEEELISSSSINNNTTQIIIIKTTEEENNNKTNDEKEIIIKPPSSKPY